MRKSWFVVAGLVVGLAGLVSHPNAQPPDVVFHGIGDLPGPGGVGSAVRDATATLGTSTLDAAGVATLNISTLPLKNNGQAMTHNIKAKYLGDASNQNSTSNTVAQTVR